MVVFMPTAIGSTITITYLAMMRLSLIASFLVGIAAGSSSSSLNRLRGGVRNLQSVPITSNYSVIEDVFVRRSAPTRNYNGVTNLGVAYGAATSDRITYVKFPVATEVRNAASIDSAMVYMRVNNQSPNVFLKINVYPCDTESWVEDLLTWDFPYHMDTH